VVNGFVVAVTVADGGSGYLSPPAVTIAGGGGSGASAFATLANGAVDAITVTDAGYGYTSTPAVEIGAPPPVIRILGLSSNGELTFEVRPPLDVYNVEWASAVNGPWSRSWEPLSGIMPTGIIHTVRIPMFYRIAAYDLSGSVVPVVWIAPGTFVMGSPEDEVDRWLDWEGPQTAVTISRGFWMGKYEITQGEYLAVMGRNPSAFPGDLKRPVETVYWDDATNYCGRLTQRERKAGRIPSDYAYRLPTEAEWEYACRAGMTTRFSYGDDSGYMELANYAWYEANSEGTTHPVGQKLPNPWGLYDMHGNVFEWCQDWWADSLPGGSVIDPQGPASGSPRLVRGGSWHCGARQCRSADRTTGCSFSWYDGIGFRVVLAPGQP
jgi:formylglycine-generating enzyme required for sulfatase activity